MPQIAYMPRRGRADANALLNILRFRGNLAAFDFVPIDNKSQEEVAAILKESLIFLSFSHREGFGLPPAEAMACGCIVVGYSGNGGDEYFAPDICYPVREGDLVTYAQTVEKLVSDYSAGAESVIQMGKRAADVILQSYPRRETEDHCLCAFRQILDSCQQLGPTK